MVRDAPRRLALPLGLRARSSREPLDARFRAGRWPGGRAVPRCRGHGWRLAPASGSLTWRTSRRGINEHWARRYPTTEPQVMLIAVAVMARARSDAAKAATLPTSCRVAARRRADHALYHLGPLRLAQPRLAAVGVRLQAQPGYFCPAAP